MEIEPVEITETGTTLFDPSLRIEPLPNCFSNWTRVWSIILRRSRSSMHWEWMAKRVSLSAKTNLASA
jgi:hypothetical protein